MNTIDKIIFAAFALCIVVGGCYCFWLMSKNGRLLRNNTLLEARLSDCEESKRKATSAIARQNEAIAAAAVRVDYVETAKKITAVTRGVEETRKIIIKSVEKDSSCENKITNIDYALRRFYGIGLHSENRNAN